MQWRDHRKREYEQRHHEAGLCVKCPQRAGPFSRILCELHRKRNILAQRKLRGTIIGKPGY